MKLACIFLAIATPAIPATVQFAGDTEALTFTVIDGRPSFSKPGEYIGGKLGCNSGASFKDMQLDKVNRHCAAPLTEYADAETPGGSLRAPHISPGGARGGGSVLGPAPLARTSSPASFGGFGSFGGSFFSTSETSDFQTAQATATAFASASIATTIPAPQPAAVPLPASFLMLAAGLFGLLGIGRKGAKA